MKKPRGNAKEISVRTEFLQRIADAVTQAKEAGVKDAPGIILKALRAKARLEAKAKHGTKCLP